MNHEHARAALPDLACGLVTGNERAEVDEHLRACRVCTAELRVYTEAAAALGMAAAVVPQALAIDGELPVLDGPGLARIVAAARSRFAAADGEVDEPVAGAAIESAVAVAAAVAEAPPRPRRFRRERRGPGGDEPTSQPALLAPIIADIPEEPAEDDAAWRRGHVIELPEDDTAAGDGMPAPSPESAEAQAGAQAEEPPDDPDAVLDRIDSLFVAGSLPASENLLSDLAPPLRDGDPAADDSEIPPEAVADGAADPTTDGTRGRGWLRQRLRGGADDSPQPEPGAADIRGAFMEDLFGGLDGDSEPPPDADSLVALDPEPTTDWTATDLFGDLLTPGAAPPIEDFDEPPFAIAFQDPHEAERATEPAPEECAPTEGEPRGGGWLRRRVRGGPTEVARASPIEDDASDSFDDFDPLPAAAPLPSAAQQSLVPHHASPIPERMPGPAADIDDLGLGGYESSEEDHEEDDSDEGKVGAGWRFWAVLFGLTTVALAGGLIAGFLVLLDARETSREFEGQLAVSAVQVGLSGEGVQGITYISADSRRALLVIDGLKQLERGQQLVVWTEETNGTVTRARAFSPNRETRQYLEITRIPKQLKRIFITVEPTPAASTPAPTSTGGATAASPTPRPVLKPTGSVVATGELPAFAR